VTLLLGSRRPLAGDGDYLTIRDSGYTLTYERTFENGKMSSQPKPGVSPPSAAPSLRLGVEALRRGDHLAAMAHFESLLRRSRSKPSHAEEALALSYYGLTLALHAPSRREAISFCERAALVEFFNPDLYLNLARVCLIHGERQRASEAIQRGLSLRPDHPGLRQAAREIGRRRAPAFPFLARSHPLNVLLGRWRHRLLIA
jgi:tetratricopeptide (TPR) repeat protein